MWSPRCRRGRAGSRGSAPVRPWERIGSGIGDLLSLVTVLGALARITGGASAVAVVVCLAGTAGVHPGCHSDGDQDEQDDKTEHKVSYSSEQSPRRGWPGRVDKVGRHRTRPGLVRGGSGPDLAPDLAGSVEVVREQSNGAVTDGDDRA